MRTDFKNINFDVNPRLLVGSRGPSRRLEALKVGLHEDVFGELAALCAPTVQQLSNYEERPYETFAELDDDEYFWYQHSDLPPHPPLSDFEGDGEPPTTDNDTADLVRLIRTVDALNEISKTDIHNSRFSFYVICWEHKKSMIGFVSHVNPISTLRPGLRFFRFGETMRSLARPDFALTSGSDLVVGLDGTAILKPHAFSTLLGDVGVIFDHVIGDIHSVKLALKSSVKLSPLAEAALKSESLRTQKHAKRLRALPDRLGKINLTAASLRKSLKNHNIDPNLILNSKGEFSFIEENVSVFFDAIDSRYFEDDFSGEKRRADRFSSR